MNGAQIFLLALAISMPMFLAGILVGFRSPTPRAQALAWLLVAPFLLLVVFAALVGLLGALSIFTYTLRGY